MIILSICLALCSIPGCQKQSLTSLPANPIDFQSGIYVNPSNVQDEYMLINYKGRNYVMFGTLKNVIRAKDISQCLGYVDGNTSRRICTLSADPNENFLVIVDEEAFMDQPFFYRAIDTASQQITVPNCIEDLGYSIW